MAVERETGRRGGDEAEEDEEDADFDPLSEPMPEVEGGSVSGKNAEPPCNEGECMGNEDELGFVEEEEYDAGFQELGSDHDEEEVEVEVEDEEEEEAEDDSRQGIYNNEEDGIGRAQEEMEGTEDELMGNALEALPELHSPGHKYEVREQENNLEDEEAVMDAISKRTRAHYSLADMTLDQLETFLQESDEDDYFHNVDDEEEYRKFLAAVTQSSVIQGDGGTVTKDDEEDEDEEDDDADFELEIEEALESDPEEARTERKRKRATARRPETRELRRERLQRPLSFAKTPLRPLVPYNAGNSSRGLFIGDRSKVMVETAYREGQPPLNARPCGSCFTPHQLGQLYCLIHEHVQLLVQVFSLCILEPSRQPIAVSTHGLLMQLVNRHESPALRQRAFPDSYFRPPYVRPTAVDQPLTELAPNTSNCAISQAAGSLPAWNPSVKAPVYSVLKVPPLDLVRKFLEDVALVVQEYKQLHIQTGASRIEKEPLFPLSESPQSRGTSRSTNGGAYPQVKKTMAAMLVENTKKQSIALVPRAVTSAVSRFIPYFNQALFPHKPPPPASANRLLFTDAEDELLATGLVTFNNDWKAIQERFLPTKSTHQIFVRQKNRSSARAPENSIKAIRRMKNSPLTSEERDSIQEALRYFKFDWNKVWQYAVPHRDPALLPRQWRTALGTQKSYKSDEASKEKRRIHEANKRRMKAMQMNAGDACRPGEEDYAGDGRGDSDEDVDETHIHEAFLCDGKSSIDSACEAQRTVQRTPTVRSGCSPSKLKHMQTIKLAPGLPSLNLPPHVRVISRWHFHQGHSQTSNSTQLHPLLLQPSYASNKNEPPTIRFSNREPAFHPYLGGQSVTTSGAFSNFHPLLQQQRSSIDQQRTSDPSSSLSEVQPNPKNKQAHDTLGRSPSGGGCMVSNDGSGVQFECEEIDDSDKETSEEESKKKDGVEFEEEEIASGSDDDIESKATA